MTKRATKKARAAARNATRAAKNAAATGREVRIQPAKERQDTKPRVTMTGLTWLFTRKPARITRQQYDAGLWFGEVCAEYLRASLPEHAGEGSGCTTASLGPAQWKFDAVRDKLFVTGMIVERLPEMGPGIIRVLEAVCFEGRTIRDLANGSDWEAVRLEERLKAGLAMAHFARHVPPAKRRSATPFPQSDGRRP